MGDKELSTGRTAAASLGGEVEVRNTGIAGLGDHRFVLIRKVAATPARFPRRSGEPAKRPLG